MGLSGKTTGAKVLATTQTLISFSFHCGFGYLVTSLWIFHIFVVFFFFFFELEFDVSLFI